MADQIFINRNKGFFLIFKYERDCIVYILFRNRISSFSKFHKLCKYTLGFLCSNCISYNLGCTVT